MTIDIRKHRNQKKKKNHSDCSYLSVPLTQLSLLSSHLKLNHFANTSELWQHIMVEVEERFQQVFLAVFQTGIHVVIITARLLHAKGCKHTTYHQRRAGCGIDVLPRTSGEKKQTWRKCKMFNSYT